MFKGVYCGVTASLDGGDVQSGMIDIWKKKLKLDTIVINFDQLKADNEPKYIESSESSMVKDLQKLIKEHMADSVIVILTK